MLLVKMPTFPQSCFDPFQVLTNVCLCYVYVFICERLEKDEKTRKQQKKNIVFLIAFLIFVHRLKYRRKPIP